MRKRSPAIRIAPLGLLVLTLAIPGCGDDESSEVGTSTNSDQLVQASAADFPRPSHRSFKDLIGNMQQGPALAPSVQLLTPGDNRFGFALFDRDRRQIGELEVVLYFARGVDETAHGPYVARFETIDVKPAYRSKTSAQDPDSAKSVYLTHLPLREPGTYLVSAVTKLGGKLVATSPAQVKVSTKSKVPGPGDAAIRVHTPTKSDVGGKLDKIDTRVPPDDMHEVDLADALDQGKPVVLLFATPALCQSRVCGPVVDVEEQVRHSPTGEGVDFIHMEVYRDNDLSKGENAQMAAWNLRSEPFAFAIDSQGKIVERLEGAFTVRELEAAVRKARG